MTDGAAGLAVFGNVPGVGRWVRSSPPPIGSEPVL